MLIFATYAAIFFICFALVMWDMRRVRLTERLRVAATFSGLWPFIAVFAAFILWRCAVEA